MKKLTSFALFFIFIVSNLLKAEIVTLDKTIKLKIPNDMEYVIFSYKDYNELSAVDSENLKEIQKGGEALGFDDNDKTFLIGKKGFGKRYTSFAKHMLATKNMETWEGFSEFKKACGKKRTQKTLVKCFVKFFKFEPVIVASYASKKIEEFDDFNLDIKDGSLDDPEIIKEIKDFNKSINEINKTFGDMNVNFKTEGFKKIFKDKWGLKIKKQADYLDTSFKGDAYIMFENSRTFYLETLCVSNKICKKIDGLTQKILDPYIYPYDLKISSKEISKKDIADKLEKLKILYDKGSLTKEEFERAKELVLN